jgi:hypothetical protein
MLKETITINLELTIVKKTKRDIHLENNNICFPNDTSFLKK